MTRTVIQFRVTEEQKARIEEVAALRGLTVSEWARHVMTEGGGSLPPMTAEAPPVAPKPVEKPRDPQPESDYRVQRRAGLRQRKL